MYKLWKEGVDGSFPNAAPMLFEKGGSAPMPVQETAQQKAEAQLLIDNANRKAARQEAEREEKKAANKRAADLTAFNQRRDAAVNNATQFGSSQINNLFGGNDRYGLLNSYNTSLNSARTNLPELASDIGAYINPEDLWSRTYDTARTNERNKLNNAVNQYFGTGWDTKLIDDTADDQYLNDLLNPQYEEALSTVERAKARGQLNDAAYANATSALGRQKQAANAKAQSMGGGVLANYRTQLGNDVNNLKSRVQNFDLTDNLDINTEYGNVTNRANTLRSNLGNDIAATIGDTQFYDINNLLGRALTAGGISNEGAVGSGGNPLATAMASALSEEERRRQLQNAGAF